MSCTDHLLEIESLRSQIAELSRTLAERDQSMQVQQQSLEHVMQDLRAQSDLLKAIMEGTAADTGDEFFASLARHLTASLHMQYAVIGEIVDGTPVTVCTLAVASGNALLDNFEYDLTQAPCGTALIESFWCYEQGVQALFPNFPPLATLGVHSHSGVSIRNKQGDVVGLIVVMDTKPITNQEQLQALLGVFAPRVAAELQRKHTETALQEQTRRLAHAQALAHLGSWNWEIDSGRMEWSDEQFRIFGHEPGVVATTHETFLATLMPDDHDRMLAAMNATLVDHAPFNLECGIVRPDGEVRVIHARGEVHRDETGHPIRMTGTVLDITERKQTEDALRASEERWQLAVQGSNDGIWDWNIQTGTVYFSPRWKAMRGFAEHEIANHVDEWRSRIHPDDLDRVLQSVDAYLAKQAPEFCKEYRVQRKDGTYMWILDRGVALWGDDDTPLRMAGSESDITERTQAEAALRESEARSRSIIETALDAVITIDKEGRIIGWNQQAEANFGYSAQEAIGRDLSETIIPAQFRQAHAAGVQRAFQSGENHGMKRRLEFSALHRDSHEFPVEFAMAMTHVGGQPVLSAFVRDVTERQRAEEALRASEERFRAAYHNASVGISICDLSGRLQEANQALCEVLGYSKEELLTTDFQSLTHPDDLSGNLDRISGLLAGAAVHHVFEKRYLRKDGGTIWAQVGLSVVRNQTGAPSHLLAMVQDITERKQAESKLRLTQFTIDHAADAVYWVGREAQIVEVNQAASLMLGYSKAELCAMTVHDLNPEFPSDKWPGFWAETRQRKTMVFETFHRSKTGQLIPVEISINYLSYEGQELHCAFVRNITERKKAQEELRCSKSRLTHILENNPAVVYARQVGNGWPMTFITPNVYKLLGYTSVDILSDPNRFDSLIHQADERDLITRGMPQLLRDGALTFVYRLRHRDGTYRWIENRAKLNDNGQGALQIVGTMSDVTERKKAEEALEEERHRLVTAQLLAHLGSWEWNILTDINTWSDENYRIFGYAPGTIQPSYEIFAQAIHPQDRERVLQAARATLEEDTAACDLECRIVRPGGEVRHVHCRSEVTRDDEGRPLRMAGTVLDITERKQAEEALRESEERFDLAVRGSNTGIWDWDLRTNKSYFSPLWKSMLGYEDHELRGEFSEWEERLHPDDLERALATVQAYLKGDIPQYELEHRLRHKDGGYRWILARGVSISDAEGKPSRIAGSHIDITDSKRAQEKRYESEAQLRAILDNSPSLMFLKDRAGRYLRVNHEFEKVFRLTSEEILGRTDKDIFPPEQAAIFQMNDESVLQAGMPLLFEEVANHGDGPHTAIVHKFPIRDEKGTLYAIGGIVTDITERKQTQEALAQRERQLQTVLDALPVGVWFTDPSGKPLLANPAAKQIWSDVKQVGIGTAANAAGWWEAIEPSDELHRWALSHVLTKGVPALNETLDFECLDGTKKTIRNTAVPVQDEAGIVLGAIVLNEDITVLRQMQEALKLTQFSVDHAIEGFFWIGPDATILHVNEAACRMLEYTRDELTSMTVHDIEPNFPLEAWPAHWEELKQKGSLTFESKHWSKTGRILNTEVTLNYLQYDGREYNCAIMRDIGERKQADAALRASEERYRALYDDTPTMYFKLTTDGTVLSVNRFGADQLGYGVEELIGHSVLSIFHEDDKEAVAASLSECLATPEVTRNWEFRKVRKDGRILWVRETARVSQSSVGETVLLVTCEDITAQKLAQVQQARQYDQLQAIFRMTLTLSLATSPDDIYREAIDCMQRALKADRASILLLDETGVMRFKASQGLSERYQAAGEGPSPWTNQTVAPQPILIDDIASTPSVAQYRDIFHAEGITALGFIPLVLPEGLLGKFMLYYNQPHHFTDEEVGVAQTIACHVAYMIQRTRADQALRVSEERYRSLVDNAPIGIFINEAGRFTYVNREMQHILHATNAEQLVGTKVLDRIAPEFHHVVKERIHQMIEHGQPVPSLDEKFLCLDGARVDVAVTAIPTSFDGIPAIQVLVLDITERKKAEDALREKHTLLSAIMDATMDIVFVKDLEGRYLHMNPAGARAVGLSVEEVVGKDDDAIWPADLAACCKSADRQILTSCTAQTVEESTTVNGNRITYLTTKAPYRDAMGRLIGIIGVAHDITEIKRSEEELRRSHAFLRQVIDIDPNFVFAKDRAGRFTLVNKAVADAYGTTVEDLIGKTDADFNTDQKEVAFFREKDLEVMDSLQDLFLPEEIITDSTGRARWLQTVKRPILDEQGRAIMVLGAATDITERKRMEEALRQRERDLRTAIEERERISQDLHDGILQSLFAVGLTLETTKSMMSPKERKTSGPALEQAIDQLNRLMHEVRNFIAGLGSDLLQGKDLPTALHHMLESLTKNHATRVRLKIEDRAAQALSAEQSLHLLLVIQEAVSNCIRHGHAQEATVSLKLLKQGVRLSVRDNGCGFNPNIAKGTGHGLINMAARAQKIGGRFTLSSKVHEGTRVVLDLPKEASLAHR